MTVMEIAKTFNLQPKDVTAFIQANATFPVKRNFQTGEISIPDNIDFHSFLAPLLGDNADFTSLDKLIRAKEESARKEQLAKEESARKEQLAKEESIRKEKLAVEAKIQQANRERQENEKENSVAITSLKKMGAEGYYQYKVISLLDIGGLFRSNSGRVNTEAMMQTLNELGMEGWHLVTAYSNELGKNAMSGGAGGFIMGTNSTVDENILIFERFVKF